MIRQLISPFFSLLQFLTFGNNLLSLSQFPTRTPLTGWRMIVQSGPPAGTTSSTPPTKSMCSGTGQLQIPCLSLIDIVELLITQSSQKLNQNIFKIFESIFEYLYIIFSSVIQLPASKVLEHSHFIPSRQSPRNYMYQR